MYLDIERGSQLPIAVGDISGLMAKTLNPTFSGNLTSNFDSAPYWLRDPEWVTQSLWPSLSSSAKWENTTYPTTYLGYPLGIMMLSFRDNLKMNAYKCLEHRYTIQFDKICARFQTRCWGHKDEYNTNLPSNCSQCRNVVTRNLFSFFLIFVFFYNDGRSFRIFFAFVYFHLWALKRDHADRVAVMFTSFILKCRELGWLLKCCGENIPSMLSSYCQQWSLTFPVLTWRCFHGKSMLIQPLKISYRKTNSLSLCVPPPCLDLYCNWKDWS